MSMAIYFKRQQIQEMQLTLEVALRPEVRDGQPEYGELVELGEHVLVERQQAGQCVQLGVESLAVTLARVGLGLLLLLRRHTDAETHTHTRLVG